MKIIDGINILEGMPVEIPNCGRDDLPGFFVEMGYKIGAEIGVHQGIFSEKLCQAGLKIYAVDLWSHYKDYIKNPKGGPWEILYNEAKNRLAPYDCTIIRKTSMDALEDFPDESLDFVYIDANHNLRYATEDIFEWNRKVRIGGVVSGHDYKLASMFPYSLRACHVRLAVDSCARLFTRNYYILGERYGKERDVSRSWLWIKS